MQEQVQARNILEYKIKKKHKITYNNICPNSIYSYTIYYCLLLNLHVTQCFDSFNRFSVVMYYVHIYIPTISI